MTYIIPLNAELNPLCHLLALIEVRQILHVSRIRVNRHMHSSGAHMCKNANQYYSFNTDVPGRNYIFSGRE